MVSPALNPVDYKVTVVKYELTPQNYAQYTIKIVCPRDISFLIRDRYSSLREFQQMVKRHIGNSDGMPSFPKKRLFGNTDAAFLQLRSQQLSLFLQVFLAHPLVNTSPLV